jgi:HEAT repeat protein
VGAWRGAPKLARADNLRLLLLDELPLLGRGVRVAAWWHPPEADDTPLDAPTIDAPRAAGEPLNWQGTSLLLITVDALRADHVGAYGYARPTTPNIDALAKRGARFDAAYCATPHTSYSVTSTMTGKYMRPLLHAGLGADSETLAEVLRRYGYRTAAFYPPAVFFIDEDRFQRFRDRHLGFEYAKVEFAKPALRVTQVEQYLAEAPRDVPLFLWVHIFEPHEPYEAHAEHDFGPAPKDLYDGEIATADQLIGDLVARFEAKRPGSAVWVSADHGEEFGEHGGRYHGTSVYDEQVRVPLVVVGPGVPAASVVRSPVSSVDVAPTLLAALNIPRAPKMSGVDLAPLLRAQDGHHRPGLWSAPGYWPPVLSETEEKSLLAEGEHRLICDKATGACRLHHIPTDPAQQQEARDEASRTRTRMKGLMQAIHRRHGALEGAEWPEALRRGMAGEADAAPEIAALLDDVKVEVRRQAARTLFRLRATDSEAALVRCKERDADDEVRAWCLLGLVRAHGLAPDLAVPLLHPPAGSSAARVEIAGYAALAMAERGDRRAEESLAQFLSRADDFRDVREGLAAAGKLQGRRLTAPVVARLDDVRYRVQAAQVLGALNDPAARPALLAKFRNERYLHARAAEASALALLGATDELYEPMAAYAGMPEPFEGALALAQTMPWFGAKVWAWRAVGARPDVLRFGAHRVEAVRSAEVWQVLVAGDCATLGLRETGETSSMPGGWGSAQPLTAVRHGVGESAISVFRSRARAAKPGNSAGALSLELDLAGCAAPRALWVVPAVAELPPPPPEPEADAGAP